MAADQRFHLLPESVRRHFADAVRTYDAAARLQAEVQRRLLDRLDALVAPPNAVLDLGSGTGRGTRVLSDRFRKADMHAVDIAEPMAAATRRRKPWFRRWQVHCADARRLPLPDASVDLVFSNLMLQWVDDPEMVFAEARRVLRPRGLLLFSTFGPDTLTELREAWATVDDAVHVNRFVDMHHLGDALVATGMVNPVMDVDRIITHYPDVRGLMAELKAIGATNANAGRPAGLTGPRRFRAMQAAYETQRTEAGLPARWEVVYGTAWAPEAGIARAVDGEHRISVSAIGRRGDSDSALHSSAPPDFQRIGPPYRGRGPENRA